MPRHNLFKQFQDLLPDAPLQVGEVTAVDGETATIELPGGGILRARGAATVGQMVFVRDSVIEAVAPSLSVVTIDV